MQELIAKYLQAIGTALIGLALVAGVVVYSLGYNRTMTLQDTIAVTGKATRLLTPNQSTLSGSWQEKGATADEARSKLNESSSKALTAIKAAGVDEKKITTTQVSVAPEYDYATLPVKEPKITGYTASTTLEIQLSDTSKAEDIIAVMTKNGAQSTSGPDLGLSTELKDQLHRELKVAAVSDAYNQAKALAEQAGGKLGDVISITDGSTDNVPMPVMYGTASDTKSVAPESTAGISIGEKEVTVTVNVIYRLK